MAEVLIYSADEIEIDARFPGGNIVVERIDGNNVFLSQDLRDTEGRWFYWYFRVVGAAGRTLRFHFTDGNVIGARGPAVSTDGGRTWSWLGTELVDGASFSFAFPAGGDDVRFSVGIPYTEENLEAFLAKYRDRPHLERSSLCRSEQGRSVEKLRLGRLDGDAPHRVLLTCRHHACEAMASFVLEGMMSAVLDDSEDARWFRRNTEGWVIPFVDKDGVENGDQGKNRTPRDHNRDYSGESIYASVRALREAVPAWSGGRLRVAIDLHCPALKGPGNQYVYLVGSHDPGIWEEQVRFSAILEKVRVGPLPYDARDNMPFGTGWNTANNTAKGNSFAQWAAGLPGISLVTTVEVPYADARGAEVTAESARLLGRDLMRALRLYLASLERI